MLYYKTNFGCSPITYWRTHNKIPTFKDQEKDSGAPCGSQLYTYWMDQTKMPTNSPLPRRSPTLDCLAFFHLLSSFLENPHHNRAKCIVTWKFSMLANIFPPTVVFPPTQCPGQLLVCPPCSWVLGSLLHIQNWSNCF